MLAFEPQTGVVVVTPENFETAICILAHFRDQKHLFIGYGRPTFEGLLLMDVSLFIFFCLRSANAGVLTLPRYETSILKFHGGCILFNFYTFYNQFLANIIERCLWLSHRLV